MTNPNRAAILELTKDLREDFGRTQDELRAVRAEINEIRNPCPRLTRLGDRDWDLSARLATLRRLMDRRVEEYLAGKGGAA